MHIILIHLLIASFNINATGSSKMSARLAATRTKCSAKLTTAIEKYNAETEDKVTKEHIEEGIFPWQSDTGGLIPR